MIDNNPGIEQPTAERIVIEALKFVHTAAKFPTVGIAPSNVVDEGWHALILHTNLYARLCDGLGHFVHHFPERPDAGRDDPHVLTRTVALIEQTGYGVDPELWTEPKRALVGVGTLSMHTPAPGGCGPIRPGNCATHGGGEGAESGGGSQ
ncbi:glycine-rich domain-containing protein [Streptomyces sp. NPDC047886]|uniref:glycine-rich domain-containing protein n=1 Tax=Streptomyces sp. NPDC047886 TaxID=3365490 RepID=UPI0037104F01